MVSWIERITAAWRSSLEGVLETGRLLIEAKAALAHGEFLPMIENDLPFGRRTAHRLMAIAQDSRLSNGTHASHLPPSWYTLYELTKLPDEQFEAKLANGEIHPEMQRKDVAGINRKLSKAADEARVLSLVPVAGKFRTLVIDPPWDYGALSIAGRAAPRYATMSHEELLALDVGAWADDQCHLYLWVTNNFLPRAIHLMAHWGFDYKTVLTWVKPRIGLGSYFRNSTEHALFGVKGDLRTRASGIPTHFEAPVGEHSEKPDVFYDIVQRASYLPAGEIFQRAPRKWLENLFVEAA